MLRDVLQCAMSCAWICTTRGCRRRFEVSCACAVLLLTGCVAKPPIFRGPAQTPAVGDFPAADISFRLAGEQKSVLQDIVNYLSENTMFHRVEIGPAQDFVVTAFFDEPAAPGARRTRKTAYRFSVGSATDSSGCSPLGLTWLTESKGIREERWSVQPEDSAVNPSSWSQIRQMLEARRCPG